MCEREYMRDCRIYKNDDQAMLFDFNVCNLDVFHIFLRIDGGAPFNGVISQHLPVEYVFFNSMKNEPCDD